MEEQISLILKRNKIRYKEQYGFEWLKNDNTNYNLYLDFYLPDYNIAIECQGGQHFISVDYFGGKDMLEQVINRDLIKYQKCKEHNIDIVYVVPKRFINQDILYYNYSDKEILILEECENKLIKHIKDL